MDEPRWTGTGPGPDAPADDPPDGGLDRRSRRIRRHAPLQRLALYGGLFGASVVAVTFLFNLVIMPAFVRQS